MRFGDKMDYILIIDTKSMSLADQEIIKEVISAQGMSCEVAYYELGNHIATGGHSSCYQVRKFKGITNDCLGEEAVLKIIDPKEKSKLAAVFENEVKVLRILNGEHCHRFSRYYTHWRCSKTQRCYILIEKCAYGSLLEFCQYVQEQGKFLTQLEILFFLREILKAVRAMHNLKMIHRDLKLQNVLIGADFSIKLIDFGLSKTDQKGRQFLERKYEGTPFFMSPQIIKEEDYFYEADMWAIGVILYYLMYFDLPFYGITKPQLKDQVLNKEPVFQRRPEYKELIAIGKRLLSRDKDMRPSADQLLKDKIFQKIEKEKDIAQRIYYKYENYFKLKLTGYKWKRQIIEEPIDLQMEHKLPLSNQQSKEKYAKFVQFVKKKCIKTQKVRIIKLIHNVKYGFFFLLSNLSLFGYFNNSKILRFHPSLLQKAQNNEQTILCCIFNKHFKDIIVDQSNYDPDLQFDEPNCSISKVSLVKDNLFVRLSNNVLQVYLTKSAKAEDGSFIFTLQLHYNTNTTNHKQITIVNSDGSLKTYKDYQQASKSLHSKYVNYVKDIFQIILDNSCISFDQLHLKRKP